MPRCEILVMSKYTSSSVNLFTSMLSQSCLNIHTGESSRTCTYISMFMLLSVSCPSLRTVQTYSIIYKYCYLWLILILNEMSQVLWPSIGLHVHYISCALAKRDNSFIKCWIYANLGNFMYAKNIFALWYWII